MLDLGLGLILGWVRSWLGLDLGLGWILDFFVGLDPGLGWILAWVGSWVGLDHGLRWILGSVERSFDEDSLRRTERLTGRQT